MSRLNVVKVYVFNLLWQLLRFFLWSIARYICKNLYVSLQSFSPNFKKQTSQKVNVIVEPSPQPKIQSVSPQIDDKIVILLDLDHTLIHFYDDDQGLVELRPGAIRFIRELGKRFEIGIFTAGTAGYAQWILDSVLLEVKPLFKYVYSRKQCQFDGKSGIYYKNLKSLKDLENKEVYLIDDNAHWVKPLSSSIFIPPFHFDPNEKNLKTKKMDPNFPRIFQKFVPK